MHRVKGIDFLMGYAVACSSSHARVQEFLSGKLQVCKVLGGVSSIFLVAHLLISMETYITSDFQGDGGPDPPCLHSDLLMFFLKTFFTYLCSFHSVLNHFPRLYTVQSARDQSNDIWRLELGKN